MVKGNLWGLAEFPEEMLRADGGSGGCLRAATRLGLGAAVALDTAGQGLAFVVAAGKRLSHRTRNRTCQPGAEKRVAQVVGGACFLDDALFDESV